MSNEDNMKIGDIVRRKAGGPKMTVIDVDEEDSGELTICCIWFDEKNNEKRGQYPARTLESTSVCGPAVNSLPGSIIPCPRRNISLRRRNEFPAPATQGICRKSLKRPRQSPPGSPD
jgi:uncharacterized protein YodC (DUF2158 family)